ncbi:CHASE2 domain-containing protein [Thalassobaculum sp. OXR-137]|uniref:CHASE2 domain-containing protein n=1 Tax=Thalassobaculum sp. OXR-137 TaxID=3100173 RepID=UPI002AC9E7E4|nr:CHASE2 domain-containing protein [Thalassobaculum sp. OXR-137]WPZ34849.1 CHASE2 domain-containing protein [Thalassobaculum sp. OXR-137]
MNTDTTEIARASPQSPPRPADRRRRYFARFLTMLLLGLTLQSIDPFGFLQYTEKKTLDLFSFMMGPELPSTWNQEMAVVLIDDVFVETHSKWPMPYIDHARVLKKILTFEPRAVFVDLLFTKDKDVKGIVPLILVLNEYKRKNIKVFVTSAESRSGMLPQIANLVTPVTTRLTRDEIDYLDYRLWRESSMTHQAPANALIGAYCARMPRDPERHEAWGLACSRLLDPKQRGTESETVVLPNPNAKSELERGRDSETKVTLSFDSETMLLLWGTEEAEANWKAFRCNPEVGTSWHGQVINWVSLEPEDTLQRCPRYPTLLLDNLLGGFPDDKLAEYLTDKIVFYGPEIEGATVWTAPPTHEALSATYTHATALENLLMFGKDYYVMDRKVLGVSLKSLFELTIWTVLCLVVSFGAAVLKPIAPGPEHSIGYRFLFDLSSFVMLSMVGILLTTVQVAAFHIAPANLLGIISIVFAISSVHSSEYFGYLEDRLQTLMRSLSFPPPQPQRPRP